MRQRVFLLIAIISLFAIGAFAQQASVQIPARTTHSWTLAAPEGGKVLAIEGRFVDSAELHDGSGVLITVNGQVMTGDKLIGSPLVVYAVQQWAAYAPQRRYDERNRLFTFLRDTDFQTGNGPFGRRGAADSLVWGCPATLQLSIDGMLKAGDNDITITNGANMPFEVRRVVLLPTAEDTEPTFTPYISWSVFMDSDYYRKKYENALLKQQVAPEQLANLLTSLGIAETYRPGGSSKKAMAYLLTALHTSDRFSMRSEAAYRLVADREQRGKWSDASCDAIVRASITADDSWAEAARGLLCILDKKEKDSPRLIIRPQFTKDPYVLDASLDEPFWKEATVYQINKPMVGSGAQAFETSCRIAVRQEGIALGFEGALPDKYVWKTGLKRDEAVWNDNCIEVFISPWTDFRGYLELNTTPIGGRYDGNNAWGRRCDQNWDGAWQTASTIKGTRFTTEYLVPWSDLGLKSRPKAGAIFVTSLIRYETTGAGGQFFGITKHRAVDCHRLQDSAFLVMP